MNYRVYPVQKTDYAVENYEVFIDGNKVELNTARVSRDPINRRWPGHQRQIEQTELINFLSFSMSAPVRIKIVLPKESKEVGIRPRSLGITPQVNEDGSVEFTLEKPAKFGVEPYGYRNPLVIFADAEKDYKVDKNDENVLYFGAGVHDLGYHEMKDNETLFIDEGAVVYATINAFNVKNIKILGRGILDNSKNVEKILFDINAVGNDADVGNAERTYPVEIDCCENVEIDGVTLRDPLVYNINCCSCKNVKINDFKAIGDWRFNSDGVHFANCIGGSLTNSFLRTYDDCACVRGLESTEFERLHSVEGVLTDCRDIVIKNNVFWSDWGVCVRIGAATLSNDICDVLVEDNVVAHLMFSPLDCYNCDYGDVHDFVYRNNVIEFDDKWRVSQLQQSDDEKYVEQYYPLDYKVCVISFQVLHHFEYSNSRYNPDDKRGQLHDIRFENTKILGKQDVIVLFNGAGKDSVCKNIVVDGIFKNGKRLSPDEIEVLKNEFTENIVVK